METLLGLALKSLLIAGATLALLHFTRNRSSSERSLIAHLGLVALVALPLASLALPAMHVALPEALSPSPAIAEIAEPPTSGAAELITSPGVTAIENIRGPAATPAVTPGFDWAPYAYAAPAAALLLITLLALLRLFALRHRAQVLVDPVWLSALAHAQRRMGFKNGTALLISNELGSPISWGLMRPVILLNDEALEASGEAEAIIAHELAHVARLDWAKLMLARVATAIFWFNPLAWVLAREAHQLREEAADDAVLAANIADTDYAQLLVGVARHECKGLLLGAHGISPGKGSLRRRVRRVLDGTLARGPAQRSWVAGFAAGMLVMAAPLAALTFAPKEKLPEDTLIGKKFAENAPAVAHAVSGSVGSAVVTATAIHPDPALTAAEEAALDAESDARDALEDARDARNDAKDAKRDAIDHAIDLKVLGITPEYAASIRSASAQLRNADTGDLMAFKVHNVSPQYIRALADTGYGNLTADEIVETAVLGITPAYVRELAAAGYRGLSLDDLTDMRAMGVTRAYIEALRKAGYPRLSPDRLVGMRAHGIKPENAPRGVIPDPRRDTRP